MTLTLKEAIGQVLMVNTDTINFEENAKLVSVCKEYSPGAFIEFSNSILNIDQVKNLNSDIYKNCRITPIISIDMEGGYVNRLRAINPTVGKVSLKEMINAGNLCFYSEVDKISQACFDLGYNMNLGPVLDHDGGSSSISFYNRSAGTDSKKVYEAAKTFTSIHTKNQVSTCMKHFPGQGYCQGDAHHEIISSIDIDKAEIESFKLSFDDDEMSPFLMTAHVIIEKWDQTYPVTLSGPGIRKIRSMGFKGVILSDDIFMKALSETFSLNRIIISFFNAGGNMLLVGNSRLSKTLYNLEPLDFFEIVEDLVKNGKIPETLIYSSARKIINAKKQLNIID